MPSFLTGRMAAITPKRVNVPVYGPTGVVSRPTLTTKVIASGGQRMTCVNGYVYHWFTSTADLTVTQGGNLVEILMVGGGGGAGGTSGQAGGAGGCLWIRNATLTSGTYNITVGAGGAGASRGSGTDTTIFKGGVLQILGDQDYGGLYTCRAGGGGGGGGVHNSGNNPKSQGGGAGARQAGAGEAGFGSQQYALRPVITNGGSGYSSGTTITFPGTDSGTSGIPNTVVATATLTVVGGVITRVNMVNPGYGYSYVFGTIPYNDPTLSNTGGGTGFSANFFDARVCTGGHAGPTVNENGGTSIGGGGAGSISSYTSRASPPLGIMSDMFDGKFGVVGIGGAAAISPSSNAYNNFVAVGGQASTAASPLNAQFFNMHTGSTNPWIISGETYYYGETNKGIWNQNLDKYGYGAFAGVYSGGDGTQGLVIIRYPA